MAQELPGTNWIEHELEQLDDQAPQAESRRIQLEQLLEHLRQLHQVEQDIQALQQALTNFPQKRQALIEALGNLPDSLSLKPEEMQTPEVLEQSLAAISEQVSNWRSQLQQLDAQLTELADSQRSIPAEIAELERTLSLTMGNGTGTTGELEGWLKLAQQRLLEAQLEHHIV